MFLLVTGGAASGKSEYAEQRAMQAAAPRVYLATMEPFGAEAQRRIHQMCIRDRGWAGRSGTGDPKSGAADARMRRSWDDRGKWRETDRV